MSEQKRPTVGSLLMSCAMVALGVWQLYARSGYGWYPVFAWAMIVLGAIGILLYPLMRVLPATSPEGAAEELAQLQKNLYSGAHAYRAATPADMRGLDARFYDSTTAALTAAGYRHLADVVDETGARAARWARAVIRVMLSSDGTVTGGIYHVKISGFPRLLQIAGLISRNMRIVSLETELDDGTFVATGNDRESNTTGEVPGIARRQLPARTSPADLLREHASIVMDTLATRPGVRPLAFRTLQEAMDSQNRSEELKTAHRRSPGFDHVAEFERTAGRPLKPAERAAAARVGELMSAGQAEPPPTRWDGTPVPPPLPPQRERQD